MRHGEPVTCPAKTGDHFVGDEEDLVLVAHLAHQREVVVGRVDDAAPAVDEAYEVQARSLVLLFAVRLPGIGQGGPCRNDKDYGGGHERST